MTDLDSLHRILFRHEWGNVADWVRSVDSLADLDDAEIERVAACSQEPPLPRRRTPSPAGGRGRGPL